MMKNKKTMTMLLTTANHTCVITSGVCVSADSSVNDTSDTLTLGSSSIAATAAATAGVPPPPTAFPSPTLLSLPSDLLRRWYDDDDDGDTSCDLRRVNTDLPRFLPLRITDLNVSPGLSRCMSANSVDSESAVSLPVAAAAGSPASHRPERDDGPPFLRRRNEFLCRICFLLLPCCCRSEGEEVVVVVDRSLCVVVHAMEGAPNHETFWSGFWMCGSSFRSICALQMGRG